MLVVSFLIDCGVNIDVQYDIYNCVINVVVDSKNDQITRVFVNVEINLSIDDEAECIFLYLIIKKSYIEMIKLLLNKEIDIFVINIVE